MVLVCFDNHSGTQMTQLPHRVPRKLKSGKKLLATDPFSEKSPRIHQITPKLGCYLENSWVFANARARSGDSAPRGQGGGSPPCTSCLLCLQKLSPEANYFPPLGTLCLGFWHNPTESRESIRSLKILRNPKEPR